MKNKIYLIPAMTVPFLASILYFNILNGSQLAPIVYLFAKIFILIFPILFIKNTEPIKKAFSFKIKELFLGFTIGVLIFTLGYFIIKIPYVSNELIQGTPFIKEKLSNFGVNNHFILMALVISFIHSMLEEYYWRWFVFGSSQKNILSALSFSLHHFIVLNFYFNLLTALGLTLVVAIGGVLFNSLYARKNNIWGAWASHVWADLFIFYVGYLLINNLIS